MSRYLKSIGDGTAKTRFADEANKILRSTGEDDLYNKHPIEEAECLQWVESFMAESGMRFCESMDLFTQFNDCGEIQNCSFGPNLLDLRIRNS